jgi:hypothetical protein
MQPAAIKKPENDFPDLILFQTIAVFLFRFVDNYTQKS